MKELLSRLRDAALKDAKTAPLEVVSPKLIEAAEEFLGFKLPKLLKHSYLEIGNGGFGHGPLIGLPGGYETSWGDLVRTWLVMQQDHEFEQGWLPIIDWGCAEASFVDCHDFQMVTLYQGEYHPEDYSFETLIRRWLDGELPALHSGGFYRQTR